MKVIKKGGPGPWCPMAGQVVFATEAGSAEAGDVAGAGGAICWAGPCDDGRAGDPRKGQRDATMLLERGVENEQELWPQALGVLLAIARAGAQQT